MSAHRQHYQVEHPQLPPEDPQPAFSNRMVLALLAVWVLFCLALNAISPAADVVTPVQEQHVEVYQPEPIGPEGLDPVIVTRIRADAFRAGYRTAIESGCTLALNVPIGSTP